VPRSSAIGALGVVPGALLAALPSATCPACLGAWAALASALGLGFLFQERVLLPLTVGFLVLQLATVAWSARHHRQTGPLVATALGAGAVVLGRLIFRAPPLLYVGIVLLVGASLWNLWLKRLGRPVADPPLVPLRLVRRQCPESEVR